jgi:integrase
MAIWPAGIRPRGNGLQIRIWRHGKLAYTETVPGDLGKSHLAAAVKRRDDLKARVRLGLALHEEDDDGIQTFAMVAQDYMETLDAKRSTSLSYENILNRYWVPAFGREPITAITQKQIKRELASIDVSSKTKKNLLIPLAGVFAHADLKDNPAKGIRLVKHQRPEIERYSPAEREALLANLSGQERAYFALLFGTGLRPGEALGLTWADWDGEELSVSKQITRRRLEPTTKTSVRRKVYVPQWVRPYLRDLPSRFAGRHIFVNTFGRPHLDTDVFNGEWRKAHEKARIPYRIPYACRHTRAAELLSAGIDPADAAAQLGHSTEMFLRTYSEFIPEYGRNQDKSRFDLSPHTDRTDGTDADAIR